MGVALVIIYLVGGLEHFLLSHILGMSSSQLTFMFFRGVAQPPTSLFKIGIVHEMFTIHFYGGIFHDMFTIQLWGYHDELESHSMTH